MTDLYAPPASAEPAPSLAKKRHPMLWVPSLYVAMGTPMITVSSVAVTSPSQATVHYEVLLLGTPLLKNQVGTAIYQDGVWKVAIASFCGLAYLEYPKGSAKLPAVCRS